LSSGPIRKNQVTHVNKITQQEHEEKAAAKRVISVDVEGNNHDYNNPQVIRPASYNKAKTFTKKVGINTELLLDTVTTKRAGILIKNISCNSVAWISFEETLANSTEGYPLDSGETISINLQEGQQIWVSSNQGIADLRGIEVSLDE
jgi:hypothetical protein